MTGRDDRRTRLLNPNRARRIVEVDDDALPDCLIRSRELIVNDLALSLVPLTNPQYSDMTSDWFWLGQLGLHLFRINEPDPVPSPDDTRTLVDDLLATVRNVAIDQGIDPDLVVVSMHYVWAGNPRYHGNPGVPPELPVGWWSQDLPDPTDGDPAAAVLDTGYAPGSAFNLAKYVVVDTNHPDPVYLDPANQIIGLEGGHGTFVSGVLVRMAKGGLRVALRRALDDPSGGGTDGFGDDASVARELLELLTRTPPRVVNMSFSTTTADGRTPIATRLAMALFPETTVFVASAGTHDPDPSVPAASRLVPRLPAADPRVVAVASVDEVDSGNQKSWQATSFTPWGPWVDVCTFGEHILSTYVAGTYPPLDGTDPIPGFAGAASGSGTSFAAPVFAAEVLRRSLRWKVPANLVCESLIASLPAAPVPGNGGLGRLYDPRSHGVGIDPRQP